MENIEIVIGTYENLLLGYKVVNKADGSYTFETSFSDDSHRGALRSMSISPNGILASSSTDDSIRIHSLRKRKDIGGLFEHSGTVNCIRFFGTSNMLSASEDNTICIWKTRNWEMLRTLKGHKSHVMAVAVHPSGKLGLSVGNNKSFLTWDLVTGKLAFQRKIEEVAQDVLFTSSGDHYILVYQQKITVCLLEDTSTLQQITTGWRINSVCFVQDDVLAVGGDDRHVLLFDALTGKKLLTLDAAKPGEDSFSGRVRCIRTTECEDCNLVIVATANGNVKVFRVNLSKEQEKADTVMFYETRLRLTCFAVYNSSDEINFGVELQKSKKSLASQKKNGVTIKKHDKDEQREKFNKDEVTEEDDDSEEEITHPETGKKRKKIQNVERQPKSKKQKLSRQREEETQLKKQTKKQKKSSIAEAPGKAQLKKRKVT